MECDGARISVRKSYVIRKFGKEGEQFSKKFNLFEILEEILFRVKISPINIIGYLDLKYSRADY